MCSHKAPILAEQSTAGEAALQFRSPIAALAGYTNMVGLCPTPSFRIPLDTRSLSDVHSLETSPMADEPATLIDLTPSVPQGATPQQCIRMWLDLMDACEQFLLAGLRREIGPDGDLRAAYRKWYAEQMEEHDRMIERVAARLAHYGEGDVR